MVKARYLVDTESTLEFYPPELGVPSSATVILYSPGGAELQASAAATVDSVATTLAADADEGENTITVADATGITKGISYLIEFGGNFYPVNVRGVSGTTIYLSGRMPFNADSGAAFVGYRLSYTLTTTHTDNKDENYRAQWAYTVDGAAAQQQQLFDVVAAYDHYPTTINDLYLAWPWTSNHLLDVDPDGVETLQIAWEQRVIPTLRAKGINITQIRDVEALLPLHVSATHEMLAANLAMADPDRTAGLEIAKADLDRQSSLLFSDLGWYDDDDDLSAEEGEEHHNASSFRITR